jgi:adenine-specific DNA glycosylase
MMRYRASKPDCQVCPLKSQCCPNAPARKIPRSIPDGARDMARDIAKTEACVTSRHERKKIEMLLAHRKHLEARSATITRAEPSSTARTRKLGLTRIGGHPEAFPRGATDAKNTPTVFA